MKPGNAVLLLAAHFALLSVLSIGGVNAVMPELHRYVVEVQGWLTDAQFADLFAIAQAAPGPNFLIVGLIGWQVAGLIGAAVAVAAIITPCGLLAFVVSGLWQRFHDTLWRRAVQGGLAPLTVGLVLAAGYVLGRAAIHGWATLAITVATVVLTVTTRIHPLWIFAAAGVIGILGFA